VACTWHAKAASWLKDTGVSMSRGRLSIHLHHWLLPPPLLLTAHLACSSSSLAAISMDQWNSASCGGGGGCRAVVSVTWLQHLVLHLRSMLW
jgi:hypothetical protein